MVSSDDQNIHLINKCPNKDILYLKYRYLRLSDFYPEWMNNPLKEEYLKWKLNIEYHI